MAGVVADLERQVEQEIHDEFERTLGGGPGGGPEDLEGAAPHRLLSALALARAVPTLESQARQVADAAARGYDAHARAIDEAAERPRRADDQQRLRRFGLDWRNDQMVSEASVEARRRARMLRAYAAGGSGEDLGFVRSRGALKGETFKLSKRLRRSLSALVSEALMAGDRDLVRARVASALTAVGEPERAATAAALPEASIAIAERLLHAYRELDEPAPFDLLDGIGDLTEDDIHRAGVDRLHGDRLERFLRDPGRPRYWVDLSPVTGVFEFEQQARRLLRSPHRYGGIREEDERRDQVMYVPVADEAAFTTIARHYAGKPGFAGIGVLKATRGAANPELSLGVRLSFSDEQGRHELWAVLPRARSRAATLPGQANACRVSELRMSAEDVSFTAYWEGQPRSLHRPSPNTGPDPAPELPLDAVLSMGERPCSHPQASWSATPHADALRLSCPDCDRRSLAVVPRHRAPSASGVALPPLDESDYLRRHRFHAALAGETDKAGSFAELRLRDGVASLDLGQHGAGTLPLVNRARSMREVLGSGQRRA